MSINPQKVEKNVPTCAQKNKVRSHLFSPVYICLLIMKPSPESLPGIKSIAYIKANTLTPNLPFIAKTGALVCVPSSIEMDFIGEPECTCKRTNEHNATVETANLTFQSKTALGPDEDYAFIVTDQYDKSYLIGIKEPPFPIIQQTQSFGAPSGEPHAITYEIEYSSLIALIPCTLIP